MHGAHESAFQNRLVDGSELFSASFILHPDDDSVRMQEVRHRCPFAQEFRIRGHAERCAPAAVVSRQRAFKLLSRLDGDRALFDDQLCRGCVRGNLPCDAVDGRQIGFAVFRWRSADTDKYRIAGTNCFGEIAGER